MDGVIEGQDESVEEISPVVLLRRDVFDDDELFLLCCKRLVRRFVLPRCSTSASLLDECIGELLTGALYGDSNKLDAM